MPGSDAIPAIVGAAIGAGGAVIAQITSATFTAKRERSRLDWEKERQNRDWKLQEDDRFRNLKQEIYGSYDLLADRSWYTAKKLIDYHNKKSGSEKPQAPEWDELERLENIIRLVAPTEVSKAVEDNFNKLIDAVRSADNKLEDKSTQSKEEAIDRAIDAWLVMNRAMRADLKGAADQAAEPKARPSGLAIRRWRQAAKD